MHELSEPTPRGHRAVEHTGEAFLLRGEERLPLELGMELAPGDLLRTEAARVILALEGSERLVLAQGSELELGERSVLQRLGEVYYRVRGAFSTEYATVEATVEGTEYLVSGPPEGPIAIGLRRGRIEVRSAGQSVELSRNQWVEVQPGQPPPTPARWPRAERAGQLGFAVPRLSPPLTLGARGGVSTGRQGPIALETFARIRLPAGWRVALDLGLDGLGAPGSALPLGAGLGYSFGPLMLAGQLNPTLLIQPIACGTRGLLALGGTGSAALSLPLSMGLRLEAELEAGYADSLVADASIGLGVDL